MFLVFRKPFIYAVAGYGVFSWVKGGVIKRMFFKGFDFLYAKVIFINVYQYYKSFFYILAKKKNDTPTIHQKDKYALQNRKRSKTLISC